MVTNCDKKSFGSRIAEKIPNVAQETDTFDVLGLPHVKIFTNDGPNSLT